MKNLQSTKLHMIGALTFIIRVANILRVRYFFLAFQIYEEVTKPGFASKNLSAQRMNAGTSTHTAVYCWCKVDCSLRIPCTCIEEGREATEIWFFHTLN